MLSYLQVWDKIRSTSADLDRVLRQGSSLYTKTKSMKDLDGELIDLLEKLGNICEEGKETEACC